MSRYYDIYTALKYFQIHYTLIIADIVFMTTEEYSIFNELRKLGYITAERCLDNFDISITEKGFDFMKIHENRVEHRDILKDNVYMNMALEIAKLGTCNRLKVGCIILREDGSIASGGYNGSLSGMRHCNTETCNCDSRCLHTAHAEENALFFSSGPVYKVYVTHEPCLVCTRMLVRRGVREVVYNKPYSSISNQEFDERKEIIDHFKVTWRQFGE